MRTWSKVALAMAGVAIGGAGWAAAVPGQGTWETTLLGRDIDGHTVDATDPQAVFVYDTVLDATWYLGGGNLAFIWPDAMRWAAGLAVGSFSGWMLPASDGTCSGYACVDSQLGELWYHALGNPASFQQEPNTGPFHNLGSTYWSSTEYAPDTRYAWAFGSGIQDGFYKYSLPLSVLAIRPGDVARAIAVPEPSTWVEMLAGLGLAGLMARVRRT